MDGRFRRTARAHRGRRLPHDTDTYCRSPKGSFTAYVSHRGVIRSVNLEFSSSNLGAAKETIENTLNEVVPHGTMEGLLVLLTHHSLELAVHFRPQQD